MKRLILMLVVLLVIAGGCQSKSGGVKSSPMTNLRAGPSQLESRMRQVLTQAVTAEDPVTRSHALEVYGQTNGAGVDEALRKGMGDTYPAVRFAAAVAAGDLKLESARLRLNELLKDENPAVKLAAGYALERMSDSRFVDWYDKALRGADSQLAGQACLLLGKLGNTPRRTESTSRLWQVIRKPNQDPVVKLQAAEALARLGDKTIIKSLMGYAYSGYADERLLAISGLGYFPKAAEAVAMLEVLADDELAEVQLGAIRALGPNAGEKYVELARRQTGFVDPERDRERTIRVRGLALLALGAVGEKKDIGLLYKGLADSEAYLRLAAARASVDLLKRIPK